MVDPEIKKATLPLTSLPDINSTTEGYTVRYRIISQDRNRVSHWSPSYLVQPDFTFVPGNVAFVKNGSIATFVWDAVTVNKVVDSTTYFIRKALEYDVWVRWDRGSGDGDWLYRERIETTSISMPIPSTWTINGVVQGTQPNRVSVEIYLKGLPIVRGDGVPLDPGTPFLKVYETLNHTV